MTLVIDDPELDRLARELAEATGVSVAEAVRDAVRAKLAACGEVEPKPKPKPTKKDIDWDEVDRILDRVAKLPVLDDRTPDEIIGYDENGLPR